MGNQLKAADDFPKHIDRDIVLVEFDGVLNDWAGVTDSNDLHDPFTDTPAIEASTFLNDLTDLGYRVTIITDRPVELVEQWLIDNGMTEHVYEVRNDWPSGTIQAVVSSRGQLFNDDFDAATTAIDALTPHWSA